LKAALPLLPVPVVAVLVAAALPELSALRQFPARLALRGP
jgi:hypothetical protein